MLHEVVLLPSFAQVEWWCKRSADGDSAGLFAQTVTTFDAWIADLWELHGDGRLIVQGPLRDMLMHAAASSVAGEAFARSVAPVAVECVRVAAGLPELESIVSAVRDGSSIPWLSPREHDFVRAMARYGEFLEQRGLIEFGSAAVELAGKGAALFAEGVRVHRPLAEPLTWIQERFFGLCEQVDLVDGPAPAKGDVGIGRAPAGVAVRFGCPSGELAQPGLIGDVVEGLGEDTSVIVTSKDPLGMFDKIERRLSASRHLIVQARKPFGQTDFGRAFRACFSCVNDDVWNPATVSDVLFGPFSGISRARAVEIDSRLRGDRLARRDEVLQELRIESEAFSQLEEIVSDPDADVLIGAFEQRVRAASWRSEAWRAEQISALGVLRKTMSAARAAGVGMDACAGSLERASVPVAFCGDGDGGEVLITTQSLAAQLEPGSFDAAIIADLTSACYPVADRDDAAATFFSKLGLLPVEPAMGKARREFNALLALPKRDVVLVRPLGDADASETYPAAVLEEFVDAYRPDPSDSSDINNPYRLPDDLQRGLIDRGEELLFANARAVAAECRQAPADLVVWPDLASVSSSEAALVMPRRRDANGAVLEKACPSPSQIEAYLACPFKWFAERRLHLESVDEGFGPLERGSFAHAVLEQFYRRFQVEGHMKVRADNLGDAREVMREVAGDLAQRQCGEKPGRRYAAASELERREVAALCNQLVAYLDFEARLLPTFHPAYLEYAIDADHAVDYAGYSLVGTVDRIDVDDAGHAVIIDYKSSVGEEHEIAGKVWGNAGKVQTRIYARAVERVLGLDVVGAIYVSYGARLASAGAYDPRVLEAAHLPGMRHERCSCGLLEEVPDPVSEDYSMIDLTFGRMLDETEAMAGDAISSMVAGDVEPRPANSAACEYCPVLACPKRGA